MRRYPEQEAHLASISTDQPGEISHYDRRFRREEKSWRTHKNYDAKIT